MYIESLNLINYRNYKNEKLNLNNKINILLGENAQGKTNVLEAIFLSCVGKSPRTNKDKELINYNENNAKIEVKAKHIVGKSNIEIYLSKNEKKRVKVNHMQVSKIGELVGNIFAIYFSPDELKLIKDCPEDRRRFLDIDISQLKRSYFYKIVKYNKILNQRNSLLKSKSEKVLKETLPIWDEQFTLVASEIIDERRRYIDKLARYVKKVHSFLTNGKEDIELSYSTFTDSQDNVKEKMLQKLTDNIEKDIRLGYTTVGPHRDDIKIIVNGIDIKTYGSQGQQRTCALSLKLAELEIFKEVRNEYPVLLLDDVLSELDKNRQRRLFEYIQNIQALITTTEIDNELIDGIDVDIINIKKGSFCSTSWMYKLQSTI